MADNTKPRTWRKQQARSKELQVIEMRRARYDWDTIAEKVGYKNGEVARQIWMRAIERRTAENIEEVRRELIETCNALIQSLWPRARQGDEKAVVAILRTMERLGKYFPGLEAPLEITADVTAPPTMEEVEAFLLGAHEQWKAERAIGDGVAE